MEGVEASDSDGETSVEENLSRKRKGNDDFAASDSDIESSASTSGIETTDETATHNVPPGPEEQQMIVEGEGGGGKLLAGYLAHEFLTKGTLFGSHWDPAAAERSAGADEPRQDQEEREMTKAPGIEEEGQRDQEKREMMKSLEIEKEPQEQEDQAKMKSPEIEEETHQEQEERGKMKAPEMEEEPPPPPPPPSYAEVAHLLKADESGIPGIVNPTDLVRWLRK